MRSRLRRFWAVAWILLAALAVVTLFLYSLSLPLFFAAAIITLVCAVLVAVFIAGARREIFGFILRLGDTLTDHQRETLERFPLPLVVASAQGDIVWHNARCKGSLLQGDEVLIGRRVEELSRQLALGGECPPGGYDVEFGGHRYTAYTAWAGDDEQRLQMIYFVDDQELKWYREEYQGSRPCVLIIQIDNYEEMAQLCKEHQHPQVMSHVEMLVEDAMHACNALVRHVERDTFIAVMEERALTGLIAERFSLLDRVRAIEAGDNLPMTLSIGVGRDAATYRQAEEMARQALDMSLGRGGDQAAVRTKNGYDFYGGVAKGVEKRTKVKTRIVANALSELIAGSSNVLVMGHQFADLDCIGAAVGICKAIAQLGKHVNIVMHETKNLVNHLRQKLIAQGYEEAFVSPDAALGLIGKDTLLIVVDTHIPHFLESREVYERCRQVVVIDHHRKMVEHIQNAVIFYHEPYASSASEMVSELVQYLGDSCRLSKLEAEALLAGIMLDTKSFVIKTGVRTFEAAAYLRRLGADTVEVRKLFAISMEEYQTRSKIVSSARLYKNCAVALWMGDAGNDDLKLLAPQAADDLLNINDVDASFVLYAYGGTISISARSMGKLNVQLIMEEMGGGGHLTMAGAQVPSTDGEAVRAKLIAVIDRYLEGQNQKK